MKKLLILAAAALMVASCTDKDQFTPAKEYTPQYVDLSYDTASTLASNAANRSKIYNIDGKYIKLSILADDSDAFYITAGYIGSDDDENQLQAEIAKFGTKIESTYIPFTSFEEVDFTQMPDDEDFKELIALPVADEADESVQGRTYASEKGSYIVRYVDTEVEGSVPVYFVVLVPEIVMDETIGSYQVVTTPYGEPKTVQYSTYAETVTAYVKQYDVLGNPIY